MPDRELSRARSRDPFTHNNFDLLRFVFASTVLFVHAQVLSQSASLSFLVTWLSSDIAVKGFFVVSGLLVFMSYDRTRNLKAYAGKRFRRVYPAYFTVVVGAAVLLYPLSRASAAAYIAGALKYVAANLVFLNFRAPFLPGVFEDNAMREVNGSLWTLKIEVAFYIAVPVIAWLCARLGRLPVLVTLYLGSVMYLLTFESLARRTGSPLYEQLGRQLPGQLSYFLVGALWYFYFPFFKRYRLGLATAAAALAVLHRYWPVQPLEPLWLGTLVTFAGFFLYAGNFGRHGDFSYGIYILHAPILQTLVACGVFAWSPGSALAIGCALVLVVSALMWHLVEKRFLSRRSHYVMATVDQATC